MIPTENEIKEARINDLIEKKKSLMIDNELKIGTLNSSHGPRNLGILAVIMGISVLFLSISGATRILIVISFLLFLGAVYWNRRQMDDLYNLQREQEKVKMQLFELREIKDVK